MTPVQTFSLSTSLVALAGSVCSALCTIWFRRRLRESRAHVDKLKYAVIRYAQHDLTCGWSAYSPESARGKCTCGLATVIEEESA